MAASEAALLREQLGSRMTMPIPVTIIGPIENIVSKERNQGFFPSDPQLKTAID